MLLTEYDWKTIKRFGNFISPKHLLPVPDVRSQAQKRKLKKNLTKQDETCNASNDELL
jgi:hypothetical protein